MFCCHCYWRISISILNHTGPFKDDSQHSSSNSTQTEFKGKEKVHVDRVVDGDTFVAKKSNGEQIKVRLIGVDTPETVKPNTSSTLWKKKLLITANNI